MSGKYILNKRYVFTQSLPATTWTIEHNMGGYAVIDVYTTVNSVEEKILPSETNTIDENTVELVFGSARSGRAVLVV